MGKVTELYGSVIQVSSLKQYMKALLLQQEIKEFLPWNLQDWIIQRPQFQSGA